MSITPLSDKLRAKYQALGGVPNGLAFDDLERTYFQVRSGLAANPSTPKSTYMHTLFDNLGLDKGFIDYRQRLMFILESSATADDGWQDAAQLWTGENPLPTISLLTPNTRAAGPAALNLNITGTGFLDAGTTVDFGTTTGLVPTVNSNTDLDVVISASDPNLAAPGTPQVTVVNAGPGGGTSNALTFTVT